MLCEENFHQILIAPTVGDWLFQRPVAQKKSFDRYPPAAIESMASFRDVRNWGNCYWNINTPFWGVTFHQLVQCVSLPLLWTPIKSLNVIVCSFWCYWNAWRYTLSLVFLVLKCPTFFSFPPKLPVLLEEPWSSFVILKLWVKFVWGGRAAVYLGQNISLRTRLVAAVSFYLFYS